MGRALALLLATTTAIVGLTGCLGADADADATALALDVGELHVSARLDAGGARMGLAADGPGTSRVSLVELRQAPGSVLFSAHGESWFLPGAELPATLDVPPDATGTGAAAAGGVNLPLGPFTLALPGTGDATTLVGPDVVYRVTSTTGVAKDPAAVGRGLHRFVVAAPTLIAGPAGDGDVGAGAAAGPGAATGERPLLAAGTPVTSLTARDDGVHVAVLGRAATLCGASATGDPLGAGAHVLDAQGRPLITVRAEHDVAGVAVHLEGPGVGALLPGATRLSVMLAHGQGDASVAVAAWEGGLVAADARTGELLLELPSPAAPAGVYLEGVRLLIEGAAGPLASAASGVAGVELWSGPGTAPVALAWNAASRALATVDGSGDVLLGALAGPALPADPPVRQMPPGLAPLPAGVHGPGDGPTGLAHLIDLLGTPTGPSSGPSSGASGQDVNATRTSRQLVTGQLVAVEPYEPLDPEAPWTPGAYRLRVASPTGQRDHVISGPLVLGLGPGGVEDVRVVDPFGRPLAVITCHAGSCALAAAGERWTAPASTVEVLGDWHRGRPTGLQLVGPDHMVAAELTLFGRTGLVLEGPVVGPRLTLRPGLVLAGDPVDPDRVQLTSPATGDVVVDARPGARGVGQFTVAGTQLAVDDVDARLEGEPLAAHGAELVVTADRGARSWRFEVPHHAASSLDAGAAAAADHVVLRSPLRLGDHHVELAAGPVVLIGDGSLAPHFDVGVRVVVPNASGYERAQVIFDDRVVAELFSSGAEPGNGSAVFHGTVPAWQLPGEHGHQLAAIVRLQRDVGPALTQVLETEPRTLTVDNDPPPAPVVQYADGTTQRAPSPGLAWPPVPGASAYEAAARPESGTWTRIAADGEHAATPSEPPGPWTGRVRAIDDVGNRGPWSDEVTWTLAGAGTHYPRPQLTITGPEPDATVAGDTAVTWVPHPSIAYVRVEASHDGGRSWTEVGAAPVPPVSWDTRRVPDGLYVVRVTAEGPNGSTSRLVHDVEVDNLDELAMPDLGTAGTGGQDGGANPFGPGACRGVASCIGSSTDGHGAHGDGPGTGAVARSASPLPMLLSSLLLVGLAGLGGVILVRTRL